MEIRVDVHNNTDSSIDIHQPDFLTIQKMSFIYNALNAGWTIKKKENTFVFSKKHEGKKEVYLETYLQNFIESNLNTNKQLT
jgi:hypothetical protein